jgi:hypothetical protein
MLQWSYLMIRILQAFTVLFLLGAMVSVASGQECSILTPADVQKITGTRVRNIPRASKAGAGGGCANYVTSDGELYLGVSQLMSASEYKSYVAAVPESFYPKREKLTDVGEEAVFMKDESGKLRYLLARKGNRGVVLFPFSGNHSSPSDDQLKKFAVLALTR